MLKVNEFGTTTCGLTNNDPDSTKKNYYEIAVDLSNAKDGTYRMKFTVSFIYLFN